MQLIIIIPISWYPINNSHNGKAPNRWMKLVCRHHLEFAFSTKENHFQLHPKSKLRNNISFPWSNTYREKQHLVWNNNQYKIKKTHIKLISRWIRFISYVMRNTNTCLVIILLMSWRFNLTRVNITLLHYPQYYAITLSPILRYYTIPNISLLIKVYQSISINSPRSEESSWMKQHSCKAEITLMLDHIYI